MVKQEVDIRDDGQLCFAVLKEYLATWPFELLDLAH